MEDKANLGLIHLYTGNGKGKTTASLGLALRAIGHGYKVYIIQFLKGGGYTGEVISVKSLVRDLMSIDQFGKDCVKEQQQLKLPGFGNGSMVRNHQYCGECRYCFSIDEAEKAHARKGFKLAKKLSSSGEYDLIILDEICGAISQDLVKLNEVLNLVEDKHEHTELVLTGRSAPEELKKIAHYVSEINNIKHPFQQGIEARKGVEY
ncbi:MAG: hypothetical protein MAG795_00153 [Candidatus Woesearchaeota archaeon]|nr:hypothetical protein [Candidatus Woesearchaeota archaeon]